MRLSLRAAECKKHSDVGKRGDKLALRFTNITARPYLRSRAVTLEIDKAPAIAHAPSLPTWHFLCAFAAPRREFAET